MGANRPEWGLVVQSGGELSGGRVVLGASCPDTNEQDGVRRLCALEFTLKVIFSGVKLIEQ